MRKHLIQFCSLFCCCLLCLVLFSVPAKAEILSSYDVKQTIEYVRYEEPTGNWQSFNTTFNPRNASYQSGSNLVSNKFAYAESFGVSVTWEITNNNKIIFDDGYGRNTFKNAFFRMGFMPEDKSNTKYINLTRGEGVRVEVKNSSGAWKSVGNATFIDKSGGFYDFSIDTDLNYDVYGIRFIIVNWIDYSKFGSQLAYHSGQNTYWGYIKFLYGEGPTDTSQNNQYLNSTNLLDLYSYYEEYVPETEYVPDSGGSAEGNGLLDSIWGDIQNGFSNLTDKVSQFMGAVGESFGEVISTGHEMLQTVSGALSEIVTGVYELPDRIISGIESLILPDEMFLELYKDDFSNLLGDRLGAVWEVGDIIHGFLTDIDVNAKANYITMPKVTIPLPDNNHFTFGGYNVKLYYSEFSAVYTILKTIIAILCTFLFVNGVRKRYDEVMGVEQ